MVSAHLCLHGPELAVSCRLSSVIWAVGHTSTHSYLPGFFGQYHIIVLGDRGTCVKNLPSCHLKVEWLGVKPVTSRSQATNHYTTKPHLSHLLIYKYQPEDASYLHDKHLTWQVKYWSGNMLGISFSISPENLSFKTYMNTM